MSSNPFDDGPYAFGAPGGGVGVPNAKGKGKAKGYHQQPEIRDPPTRTSNSSTGNSARAGAPLSTVVEPIWTARAVEWQIPSFLSAAAYSRLSKASRLAGSVLGIASSSDVVDSSGGIVDNNVSAGEYEGRKGGGGGSDGPRREGGSASRYDARGGDNSGPIDTSIAAAAEKGGYIAGLMERVWTGSSVVADGGRVGAFRSIQSPLHNLLRIFISLALLPRTW